MVQAFQMSPLSETVGASVRALSSLTRRDADAIRATVRAASCSYAVQEHDDYDGYLSLLLTPASDALPSYMVGGRTGAVDLAELQGDDMTALGTFPSIGAAMAVLRPALERQAEARLSGTRAAADLHRRHGADAGLQAAMKADAQPGRTGWAAILRKVEDQSPA